MEKQTEKTDNASEEATTVGMFLKYTRMNQKKTLDAVSKALCIRKIYIKAIEESDFNELAPVPYGIGFVRSYAEYLGLNSDRIVQCYKEEAMPRKHEEAPKHIVDKHTAITIPNKRQIFIGIAAVACIYLVWLIVSCKPEKPSLVDTTPTAQPAVENSVLPEVDSELLDIANSSDLTVVDETNEAEKLADGTQIKMVEDSYYDDSSTTVLQKHESRIVVKFNGESWFEIRDKEKVYVTGIFQKGYTYNVPDQPGLILSVGRYYNVDVYIDGQLTQVARPRKQTGIELDKFLNH